MRLHINRIISCVVTLLLIISLVWSLGILVRPTDISIEKSVSAIKAFHTIPEKTLEVIGYGSSHMWCTLVSMELYEKFGIGAYNYGCNWQHINTTALFFKESLLTQAPKIVLIETYQVNSVLKDVNMNGEIYYTRELTDFEGKYQYLRQCFGNDIERYLSYYMPLSAFHDNWVAIKKESFSENSYIEFYTARMGYSNMNVDTNTPVVIPDQSKVQQLALGEDAVSILDEIVGICNKKNIDIIFFTAPWAGDNEYSDAMKKYAEENGCVYLDLFEYIDEIGIDEQTDFRDAGHLYPSGSIKVTDFLGEYIVDNYDVTDMRTVEGNIWEKNLS